MIWPVTKKCSASSGVSSVEAFYEECYIALNFCVTSVLLDHTSLDVRRV